MFQNFDTSARVDWHNYTLIKLDSERVGNGEHGRPHKLEKKYEKLERTLYNANGFSGLVSDYIALDRAVPDIRHKE